MFVVDAPATATRRPLPARHRSGTMTAAFRTRALAPDLARGAMLLLIVISNSMFFLWGQPTVSAVVSHAPAASTIDAIVQFLMITLLDYRVFPLFAFLFGYGVVQFHNRLRRHYEKPSRALRRRHLALLILGALHATLLLATDVLFAWGLLGLVIGALFLRRSDRTLLGWAIAGTAILVVVLAAGLFITWAAGFAGIEDARPGPQTPVAAGVADYMASIGVRLQTWAFTTTLTVLGLSAPVAMLLGCWAARLRVLEEPGHHLILLRRTAILGIGIGLTGSLPAALTHIGAVNFPDAPTTAAAEFMAVQWSTGLAGGVGYVALFGLLAHRLQQRDSWQLPIMAVTAMGERSLSCYLTHSLLLAPVLAAWGLGLGKHLTPATMALYAAAAWLLTALGAAMLARRGTRGPVEAALRRVVYQDVRDATPVRQT